MIDVAKDRFEQALIKIGEAVRRRGWASDVKEIYVNVVAYSEQGEKYDIQVSGTGIKFKREEALELIAEITQETAKT